jgi:hypothetical protein
VGTNCLSPTRQSGTVRRGREVATDMTEAAVAARLLPEKVVRESPVRIDSLLTKAQFVSLTQHMLNGNPPSQFLMAWRDESGTAHFAKAQPHRDAETHAGWTYDTVVRKAKRHTSMGLYPKNKDNESTWAALDFDAHDPTQRNVAQDRAVRAFTLLLEYRERYLILCDSGRGYHVFIFAHEPRPVAEWVVLLKDAADSVAAPIQDGVCEIFPNEKTAEQEVGKPIRVPGSLNPTTGKAEKIMAETIQPLIDRLAEQEMALKNANRERRASIRGKLSLVKEANSYFTAKGQGRNGFFAGSTEKLIAEVLAKYPVRTKGTRNGMLTKLAGELFRKFGLALAEQIVRQHYQINADNVTTGLAEHLREFREAWKSFRKKELARLSPSEREKSDKLSTEAQREGFFLCRSFANLKSEFPISQASLADRLSLTKTGAGYVIYRLLGVGVIEKTAAAKAHVRSAHYKWTRDYRCDPGKRSPKLCQEH